MAAILVVDDERSMRELLEILLRKEGHAVTAVPDATAAIARIKEDELDLVITDLKLGRGSGIDVLEHAKRAHPATEVIVITAFATTENAVQAMKLGAYDYLLKPFKVDELLLVIGKALEHRTLLQENRVLKVQTQERDPAGALLGGSPAIQQVRSVIEKVAAARTTVLITGESGTGKEVVARSIHGKGERREQPFVAINCGAIPEGLIESELFGHEKGSFTGAAGMKLGLFELASSGTVFLDEVGELPSQLQVKLLRVLQERKIRRVGGTGDINVSARVIAATNRDLAEEVKAGRFREDLFYRLNVIQIRMPPLRERREDVPLFLDHFLRRFAEELGRAPPGLSPEAERMLVAYDYPGNVRELENIVERAVTLGEGERLDVAALPPTVRGTSGGATEAAVDLSQGGLDLQAHLDAIERRILLDALERTGGVKTEAAKLLSLTFRSLRYRLAKYGIGE